MCCRFYFGIVILNHFTRLDGNVLLLIEGEIHDRNHHAKIKNFNQSPVCWGRLQIAYQFQITSASSDIGLLVLTLSRCASVRLTIFAGLWSIRARASSTGTSSFRASSAFQCWWDDLWWQVEVLSQILDAFVGQVPAKASRLATAMQINFAILLPVVVSPSKLLLHQVSRLERLHCFDDVKIRHVLQLGVLQSMEILLSDQDAFLEQMFVDRNAVSFRHKHDSWSETNT